MIGDRPLTGFGGGSFSDAFQLYHRLPLSADFVWDRAHNLYLELLADMGVFGVAPLFAIAYIVWKIASTRSHGDGPVVQMAAVTVAVIAAVHSVVDFSLQVQAVVLMFLLVLGVAFGQACAEEEHLP
jgi:O-antigen ligase